MPTGRWVCNGAALRAMAAVDEVHLVVVTTNIGPSVREPRHKHRQLGEAQPDRPYDRVAVTSTVT